jgi:hypothetical protein
MAAAGTLVLPRVDALASASLFFAICAVAAFFLLAPFRAAPYPAMADYSNHLARAQIIVDEAAGRSHPYYEVRPALVPNLALDTLVPLGVRLGLTTNDALRLFAALALLMPLAGVIAMGFALQGGVPWLALLALPLGYSRYYAWGFLNYFFALGLAFLGFALWVQLRRSTLPAAIALAACGLLALLAHLAGFALLAVLVACHEASHWRDATHRTLAAAAAIALCGCAYLLFFEHSLPLTAAWQESALIKLRNLASPFVSYALAPGLVLGVAWLATLFVSGRQGTLRPMPGWRLPLAVLVLLVLALPSMAMNSYYLTARLVIVVPLVFLAYARFEGGPRAKLALSVAALALVALKAVEVRAEWRGYSDDVARYRAAFQALPARSRVATVVFASGAGIVPARHAAAFAVIDRDAFVPNFYGFPFNGESVAFRPEMRALAAQSEKDHVIYGPGDGEPPWAFYCAYYDALFVLRLDSREPALPACAQPLQTGHGFTLYRLSQRAAAR